MLGEIESETDGLVLGERETLTDGLFDIEILGLAEREIL